MAKSHVLAIVRRKAVRSAHRHGEVGNAVEQHVQGGEEEEARNLLPVVGGPWVDVGSEEECGSNKAYEDALIHLGLVHHQVALQQRELPSHQSQHAALHCSACVCLSSAAKFGGSRLSCGYHLHFDKLQTCDLPDALGCTSCNLFNQAFAVQSAGSCHQFSMLLAAEQKVDAPKQMPIGRLQHTPLITSHA